MITKETFGPTVAVVLVSMALTACSSNPYSSKNSQRLYTQLDSQDSQLADDAARYALEKLATGKRLQWNNPDSGNSGEVTPTATWYVAERGQYCRAYEEVIRVGDQAQRYRDIACRNERGVWVSKTSAST
ncbi:RT0821/Lpp0805 family surface protein [Aestuariirhabdus sp. LZHN29]|uniref:RT0821/Lpp0805 family surface protein n=1 Tax=Aestuariirhabdus sp. LZHN29 TaxID=3417462 RepID=UPI003CEF8014